MIIRVKVQVMKIVRRPLAIETEPMLSRRNVRIAGVVVLSQLICPQMPLPDVACLVTVAMQNMTETVMIRVHAEFINRHTGATRVFAGKE